MQELHVGQLKKKQRLRSRSARHIRNEASSSSLEFELFIWTNVWNNVLKQRLFFDLPREIVEIEYRCSLRAAREITHSTTRRNVRKRPTDVSFAVNVVEKRRWFNVIISLSDNRSLSPKGIAYLRSRLLCSKLCARATRVGDVLQIGGIRTWL